MLKLVLCKVSNNGVPLNGGSKLRPFLLVPFTGIHSGLVAVAGTNSKDLKAVLKSRSDIPAYLAIGCILVERAREADVYTASYTPRERDNFEGKIRAVVQSLIDNGIDIKVYLD